MSKTFGSKLPENPAKEVQENSVGEPIKEREITSKFVSDGVYKYVYVDTGEDYKP